MAILAGAVLRTTMNFTLGDGTQYQNVYHHQRIGPGLLLTDAQHVAALSSWAEDMYAELDDQVSLNIVEGLSTVDRVEFVEGEWTVTEAIGTFTIAWVPTLAANAALPNQVSPFVSFKTARPKSVGRKFLFPFTEAGISSGLLEAASVAAMVAYADDAVNNVEVDFPL
ncbi:MAG: hypothetical protein KAR39_13370, partial [Thermoplasmata archaeon]|nr:hypothetical protein [Thermoplasmata archaeon]